MAEQCCRDVYYCSVCHEQYIGVGELVVNNMAYGSTVLAMCIAESYKATLKAATVS